MCVLFLRKQAVTGMQGGNYDASARTSKAQVLAFTATESATKRYKKTAGLQTQAEDVFTIV